MCICLYGAALWSCYKNSTMLKLKYWYHKCIKKFFGYNKFHSVTEMLLDLGLYHHLIRSFIITDYRAGSVSVFGVGIGIRYFRRYFFMSVRYSVSVSVFLKYWLKSKIFGIPYLYLALLLRVTRRNFGKLHRES